MFSKKYKITRKEDFSLIYKKGTLFQSECLKVFILANSLNYNRFSVVVPKSVSPKAVVRNRVKRKLKNILIGFDAKLSPTMDIIIKTFPGADKLETTILKEKFEKLFKKINHIKS